jgi:hypothetical protein
MSWFLYTKGWVAAEKAMHEVTAEWDVASLRRSFIERVQLAEETEHAGRLKQLFEEQHEIAARLVELGHHSARELRPLIEHPDGAVRLAAAYAVKPFDLALFTATIRSLGVAIGKTGQDARAGLRWLASADRNQSG